MGVENVKIHGDGIVIGKGKYKHPDVDLLPPLLTASNAKTIQTETDVFFQSEFSPFSNFYFSRFGDQNSQLFECLEQAFQYRKADYHNNQELANKILATRNPYEHKRLGNLVEISQQWRETEAYCMAELLLYKFTQNTQAAEMLIATGDRRLHEALGDNKWATGSDLSSKATKNGTWSGNDLLGQLLEGTWETILMTRQAATPTTPTPFSPPPPQLQPTPPLHDDLLPIPDGEDGYQPTSPSPAINDSIVPLTQAPVSYQPCTNSKTKFSLPPPPPPPPPNQPTFPLSWRSHNLNLNTLNPHALPQILGPVLCSTTKLPIPNLISTPPPAHLPPPAAAHTAHPNSPQQKQTTSRHLPGHVITAQPMSPSHNIPSANAGRQQPSKLALSRLTDSFFQSSILSQDLRTTRSTLRASYPDHWEK